MDLFTAAERPMRILVSKCTFTDRYDTFSRIKIWNCTCSRGVCYVVSNIVLAAKSELPATVPLLLAFRCWLLASYTLIKLDPANFCGAGWPTTKATEPKKPATALSRLRTAREPPRRMPTHQPPRVLTDSSGVCVVRMRKPVQAEQVAPPALA